LLSSVRSLRSAGAAAVCAGLAWVLWAGINTATHGALDVGAPAVSPRLARGGQLLMVAWNLLLLPVALALHAWLSPRQPERMRLATVCGIGAALFWAYGGATHGITPVLEVSYLVLSGIWWVGVGTVLRQERRVVGVLTIVLGLFALWDATLTALEPVPFGLYLSAAPKLPLSILWDFAIGVTLVHLSRLVAQGGRAVVSSRGIGNTSVQQHR